MLAGLSPKQNRDVPPLDHARVWRLKRELPQLTIIINGGLRTVLPVTAQFSHLDGSMLGREAYHNPFVLAELHRAIYADDFIPPEPAVVVAAMQTMPSARSPPVRRYGRSRATCWGCWWLTRRARPRHALTEGVSRPGATPARCCRRAAGGTHPDSINLRSRSGPRPSAGPSSA